MKLPIAIATLLLAAGTALPAVAATPGPISAALRDAAVTPIEAVAERTQAQVQRQRQLQRQRNARIYRDGSNAWAAQPRGRTQPYPGWGNCVSGITSAAGSAYPSWDRC
jgi:hypothetical protein